MKKRRASIIFFSMIFIVGFTVMAYPFFANWYNQRGQNAVIEEYESAVSIMKKEEIAEERELAKAYNESLRKNVILTDPFDIDSERESSEKYQARLNINGDSVMGFIEIPQINVKLAIYHGVSMEVLDKGVGHLDTTSLPIGGIATHAVLSAHTGHPTATLFSNLTQLEKGDMFFVTVLDEIMAYEIDQIRVVLPSEMDSLKIDPDEDYVTLVTCTPYGVNTHRLLVRGTRVPYVEEDALSGLSEFWYLPYIIALVIVVLAVSFIIVLAVKKRRRRSEKK